MALQIKISDSQSSNHTVVLATLRMVSAMIEMHDGEAQVADMAAGSSTDCKGTNRYCRWPWKVSGICGEFLFGVQGQSTWNQSWKRPWWGAGWQENLSQWAMVSNECVFTSLHKLCCCRQSIFEKIWGWGWCRNDAGGFNTALPSKKDTQQDVKFKKGYFPCHGPSCSAQNNRRRCWVG